MAHRCEDPICWRDDGTHAEGCVFWIHSATYSNYLPVRGRHLYGNPGKVVLNPPENLVDAQGQDYWRDPPEGT